MFCGKCGAEVPAGYEFCMKCGTKIEITQGETVSSDIPVVKKKKALIPIISIIAVLVIAAGAFLFIKSSTAKNGLFLNIAWGTDKATVKEKIEKQYEDVLVGSENNTLIFSISHYDGKKGITAFPILTFDSSDKLEEVSLCLSISDESSYSSKRLVNEYKEEYDKLYGKSVDSASYSDTWESSKSEIEFLSLSDELFFITYKPK